MCKWREAMMPQMEIATVVPKTATPEETEKMLGYVYYRTLLPQYKTIK